MSKITLIGLGPGGEEGLTLGALEALKAISPLFLRTEKHPAVSILNEAGIPYHAFDDIYGQEEDYEAVYASMARRVLEAAMEAGQAAYALPGHPLAAEKSVQLLLEAARREGIEIEMRTGGSFMEAVLTALCLDPSRGVSFLDALEVSSLQGPPAHDLVIFQLFNARVASGVKLKLMNYFADDYPVTVVKKAGISGEQEILKIKLYELDRQALDHLTSLYVPHQPGGMDRLLMIMEKLRGEKGCPWDREQDFRSLRPYVIEEAYEVVEAVNSGDDSSLVEELGDLLLQVVFFAQIARERGVFDFWDVTDSITEKIIRRHPHVFGSLKLSTAGEVIKTWDEIKKGEAGAPSCLKDVGKGMTALRKAGKLQKKAAELGFDWPHIEGAWEKVAEELKELKEVYKMGVLEKIEDEMGDVFFALVNVARFLEVDPEVALSSTNNKFCQRFAYIEAQVKERGGDFGKYTLEELDMWWERAKKINKNGKS
jgi:tetrapyrrole methylase family protein / MazG family protein